VSVIVHIVLNKVVVSFVVTFEI